MTAASDEGKGGEIRLLGDKVGLLDISALDVSGLLGGGTVLIGGDFQGKNPDIQNATATYVGKDTSINADAIGSGNGGRVIVWADEVTRYFGDISVAGGVDAGNGGFVEVSGKQYLSFNGTVNLSAQNGQAGQLLLDPDTLNVVDENSVGSLDVSNCADPCNVDFTDGGATESVSAAAIEAITSGTITLQATQTININDLTLNASDGAINLQTDVNLIMQTRNDNVSGDGEGGIIFTNSANSIIAQGLGSITLEAGTSGTDGGSLTAIGNLQTDTGFILLRAADAGGAGVGAGDIDLDGTITSNGGDVIIQASGNITVDGIISTSGGGIHLEANSPGVGNNGAGGADDDTGADSTLTINAGITSSDGNITLIGEDDEIAASVNAGSGNINIAELGGVLSSAFDISNSADLTQAEIDNLVSTGTLTLGHAETAGTDGFGAGAETVIASTLSVAADGAINIPGVAGGTVVLTAQDGVTLNESLTVASGLTINADNQDGAGTADGTGSLTVVDTFTLDTTDNPLNIIAADLELNTSGAIDSGTAGTTITVSNDGNIGLGNGAGALTISGSQLQNISAASLDLITGGDITVDNLVAANSANITGLTTLDATNITFGTAAASEFTNSLTAMATGEVSVDFKLEVTDAAANITLDAPTVNLGDDIVPAGGTLSGTAGTVNVEDDDASIQDGIDIINAVAGGTVNVLAGEYIEDLSITTDNLILDGVGTIIDVGLASASIITGVATQLQGDFPDTTSSTNIEVNADGFEIRDFTIQSPNAANDAYSSGMVLDGSNIVIDGNEFIIQQQSGGAIAANGNTSVAIQTVSAVNSPGNDITGLTITNNTFDGQVEDGYYGVYINRDGANTG
ncbi:MAG: hypothetical protein WD601_13590, partial [Pseudohongiellaceae bacterium]